MTFLPLLIFHLPFAPQLPNLLYPKPTFPAPKSAKLPTPGTARQQAGEPRQGRKAATVSRFSVRCNLPGTPDFLSVPRPRLRFISYRAL